MAFNYDKKYFHNQRLVMDCWFACYLMAKDMVNRPATKSDYEAEKKWFIENRNIKEKKEEALELFQTGAGDDVLNMMLKERVDTHYEIKFNPDINFIRDCLDKDYPVIIGFNTGAKGHYCMVTKADTDNRKITIVNPNYDGDESERDMPDSCTIQYYKA